MKLIKEFENVDLAVSKVLRTSQWMSPASMQDENGVYIELSDFAAEAIAMRCGLTLKAATLLYSTNAPKWAMFKDAFSNAVDSDDEMDLCFTNKAQTVIYSFLDMAYSPDDETNGLEELYKTLNKPSVVFTNINLGERLTFIAIENITDIENPGKDVKVYYMFTPETKNLFVFALRNIDGIFNIAVPFNNTLVGKKHIFDHLNLDYSLYSYDLDDTSLISMFTTLDITFSLRELIEMLSVTQGSSTLAANGDECITDYLVRLDLDSTSEKTQITIKQLYEDLNYYYFYYDNEKTFVNDPSLIHTKKAGAKTHLYFSREIANISILRYISTVINLYLTAISKHADNRVEMGQLVKIVVYYTKLLRKQKFDGTEVPTYYVKDELY